jgi:hypothetical protein
MKAQKLSSNLRLSQNTTSNLSCNDLGFLNTTVSRCSNVGGNHKLSNITDFKTITSDSDCMSVTGHVVGLKRTNTFTKDLTNKKISIQTSFFAGGRDNKLVDKYNEIFDRKKMIFTSSRQKTKKRIYRTKDGTCFNLLDELNQKRKKVICSRTEYEINQIKTKINFMKCVCDYSYPRIVSKQISMFKKLKDETKKNEDEGCRDLTVGYLKTEETVRSSEINKTSSYFFSLQTDPMNSEYMNFPKIMGKSK